MFDGYSLAACLTSSRRAKLAFWRSISASCSKVVAEPGNSRSKIRSQQVAQPETAGRASASTRTAKTARRIPGLLGEIPKASNATAPLSGGPQARSFFRAFEKERQQHLIGRRAVGFDAVDFRLERAVCREPLGFL